MLSTIGENNLSLHALAYRTKKSVCESAKAKKIQVCKFSSDIICSGIDQTAAGSLLFHENVY